MSAGIPGLMGGTLQGMDVLTMMQALQQREQEELMARSSELEKQAAAAQQQYTGAAGAPAPQLPAESVFASTLLGNIASVIGQNPAYAERAQQNLQSDRNAMLQARAQNLSALRDVYSQKADEAQRAGDLETTEKYRRQFETLSKTLDVVENQANRDARAKEAADKAKGDAEETPQLTEAGLDAAALMFAKTGQMPAMGMGKAAAKLRAEVINRAARMNPNLDLAGNQAQFRSDRSSLANLQKTFDAATAFEKTAIKNANVMMNAMANIPDTGSPWLNIPLREINRKALGSADLAAFEVARRTVIPEFARLMNSPTAGGQLSDTARKEIDEIMRGNYSMNQMQAALDVLKQDAQNRRESYAGQIEEIKGRLQAGGGTAPAAAPAAAPADTASQQMIKVVGPKGQRGTMSLEDFKAWSKKGWKRG